MTEPQALVMRRSIILWIGTVLVVGFNLVAAFRHEVTFTYAALVATGSLAVFGIGFGIWAARTMTRRQAWKVLLRPKADVGRRTGTPTRFNLAAGGRSLMLKKDEAQHPVPDEWRSMFRKIADAFAAGDFGLRNHPVDGVAPISAADARRFATNVAAYGEALAPLHDQTWDRSVCLWMDGYWDIRVDLSTRRDAVSDLTLHAKLHDRDDQPLEIYSIHVP